MTILLAKSGYPDQAPRSVAFYQGLHCLPVTLLQVPRLQWGLMWRLIRVYIVCTNLVYL